VGEELKGVANSEGVIVINLPHRQIRLTKDQVQVIVTEVVEVAVKLVEGEVVVRITRESVGGVKILHIG
jgi:hypothetical protein